MNKIRCPIHVMALAGLAVAPVATFADAQPGERPRGRMDPSRVTVLSLETVGIDQLLVDPKDEGLKRAYRMIPARLGELAADLAAPPEPRRAAAAVTGLLEELWGRPLRVALQYAPSENNPFGVAAVVTVSTPDEATARRAGAGIKALLQDSPMGDAIVDSTKHPGMSELDSPLGVIRVGPMQTDGRWGFALTVGEAVALDRAFSAPAHAATLTLPGGNPRTVTARLDLAPLSPLIDMFIGLAGGDPAIEGVVEAFREVGYVGPDASWFEYSAFHAEDRAVSTTRIVNARPYAGKAGYALVPLSPAQLRALPADTHFGAISSVNIEPTLAEIRSLVLDNPMVADVYQDLVAQIRIDPFNDVLGQFNGIFAYYCSDSTGGGGFGSFIIMAGLKDPVRFSQTSDRVLNLIGDALGEAARAQRGRNRPRPWATFIEPRKWSEDGVTYATLTFPGFPAPIEPTYAIAGEWFILGFSPQAVRTAARQATGRGDAGIASHPVVASTIGREPQVTSLALNDVHKTMRSGYQLLQLGGAALANAVRSRPGATPRRDPGFIVPGYNELLAGARPQVSFTRWVGDDLVTEWQGDRSLLVNLGGTVGAASTFAPLLIGFTSGILGATRGAELEFQQPIEAPMLLNAPARRRGLNVMLPTPMHAAPVSAFLDWVVTQR
jgi:hypothetical protein